MSKNVNISRATAVMSIRIKPKLKAAFKEAVQKKGFSTCFIIETLIQGWLAAAPAPQNVNKCNSLTINQNIEYLVERPRRRSTGVLLQHLDNCYDKKAGGIWVYRAPESKSDINPKNQHHISCSCNQCRPYVRKKRREMWRVDARKLKEILPTS